MNPRTMVPNRALVDRIDEYSMRCSNVPCSWKGLPSASTQHAKECAFETFSCRLQSCDISIRYPMTQKEHDQECGKKHADLAENLGHIRNKRKSDVKNNTERTKRLREAIDQLSKSVPIAQLPAINSGYRRKTFCVFNTQFAIVGPYPPRRDGFVEFIATTDPPIPLRVVVDRKTYVVENMGTICKAKMICVSLSFHQSIPYFSVNAIT